jgi:hypothetical protein
MTVSARGVQDAQAHEHVALARKIPDLLIRDLQGLEGSEAINVEV